jgi:hypothetical protein
MNRVGHSALLWLLLSAAAVPIVTSLPYGVEWLPADPGPSMSERNQARAVAIGSYEISHGCRSTEPYPPLDEQRSALVEDAPGVIRLTSIDEGRAILSGQAPGTLLAVCERTATERTTP